MAIVKRLERGGQRFEIHRYRPIGEEPNGHLVWQMVWVTRNAATGDLGSEQACWEAIDRSLGYRVPRSEPGDKSYSLVPEDPPHAEEGDPEPDRRGDA